MIAFADTYAYYFSTALFKYTFQNELFKLSEFVHEGDTVGM